MTATLTAQVLVPLLKEDANKGATADDLVSVMVASLEEVFPMARADAQTAGFLIAGRAARLELLREEGGCVDSAEAAKLYASDPSKPNAETVRKAAREGRLIAVRNGHRDFLFPIWQFAEQGGALPGIARTLAVLRESPGFSEITPIRFFLEPHARTSGRPIDALRRGDVEAVISAAAAERD